MTEQVKFKGGDLQRKKRKYASHARNAASVTERAEITAIHLLKTVYTKHKFGMYRKTRDANVMTGMVMTGEHQLSVES